MQFHIKQISIIRVHLKPDTINIIAYDPEVAYSLFTSF